MNGSCGTKWATRWARPGVQAAVADAWNYRFGIYKNSGGPGRHDHARTSPDMPTPRTQLAGIRFNAYDGTPPAGAHPTRRTSSASAPPSPPAPTPARGACGCAQLRIDHRPGPQQLPEPGRARARPRAGTSSTARPARSCMVPVDQRRDAGDRLRLHADAAAAEHPDGDVQLEYLGNAGAPGAPAPPAACPAASPGPLVPVLVQVRRRHEDNAAQRGVAIVEFALILPFLLLLTFITTEFGRAIYQYNTLTKSVRDAARYLSIQMPGTQVHRSAQPRWSTATRPAPGSPLAQGLTTRPTCRRPAAPGRPPAADPVINTVTVRVCGYSFMPHVRQRLRPAFGDAGAVHLRRHQRHDEEPPMNERCSAAPRPSSSRWCCSFS